MTIVELCVHMDCSGCESKIKKALHKVKGVDEVEVDMVAQKVTVTGWADQKKVLKAARKTGRRAVLWPFGGYGGAAAEPRFGEVQAQHYYHQHQPGGAAAHHAFHPACGPAPSSSYNYYKHGYDEFNAGGGYYQHPRAAHYSMGGGAASIFSDENPHACSIM